MRHQRPCVDEHVRHKCQDRIPAPFNRPLWVLKCSPRVNLAIVLSACVTAPKQIRMHRSSSLQVMSVGSGDHRGPWKGHRATTDNPLFSTNSLQITQRERVFGVLTLQSPWKQGSDGRSEPCHLRGPAGSARWRAQGSRVTPNAESCTTPHPQPAHT